MRRALVAIVLLAFFSVTGEARSAGVDLEVILAADVSRSIDDTEFDLQRKGYAAALTDPRVLAAIRGRSGAAIGVCFIEWSGDEDQQVVVDWTEIRDEEDAGSMAAAILAAPRSFMGRTSISAAIDFAMAHFANSKWQAEPPHHRHLRRRHQQFGPAGHRGPRPGDRPRRDDQRAGDHQRQAESGLFRPHAAPGRAAALLPAECHRRANAFMLVVKDFNSFADAMANKLAKEIDVAAGAAVRQASFEMRRR